MTFPIINSTVISNGIAVDLGSTASCYILEGALVGSTDDTPSGLANRAVYGTGNAHKVMLDGTAMAAGFAIHLGSTSTSHGSIVRIGETGRAFSLSSDAIMLEGYSNKVRNDGTIDGANGIHIADDDQSTGSQIINNALIEATDGYGIKHVGTSGIAIINHGRINAASFSVDCSITSGVVWIINDGTMNSNVLLGSGNDYYDGRDGRISNGTVIGNAGSDTLLGGKGADKLAGGIDADTLTGGKGADQFIFAEDTAIDIVTDFSRKQHDRINVNPIDAIAATEFIPDDFTFIGTRAFGTAAGELRYQIRHGDTIISCETTGDGKADTVIHLVGEFKLSASDFIL